MNPPPPRRPPAPTDGRKPTLRERRRLRKAGGSRPDAWIDLAGQREAADHLERLLRAGRSVLVSGPQGSGKTRLASQVALRLGRPVEVFHLGGVTDAEATLLGTTELRGGETRFVRSRFIEAIEKPHKLVVLDEFSRCTTALHNRFLSLLDDQRCIVLDLEDPERRVVHCAPGVSFVATANIGAEYVGTEPLDRSLMDRLFKLRLGYPDDEHLLLRAHGVGAAAARRLVKKARAIRHQHESGGLEFGISTRRLIGVAELVSEGFEEETAFLLNLPVFDDATEAAARATLRAVS